MQCDHANPPHQIVIAGTSVVIGPGAEVAQGTPVEEISVGPSPALAMHNADWRYGEGVVGQRRLQCRVAGCAGIAGKLPKQTQPTDERHCFQCFKVSTACLFGAWFVLIVYVRAGRFRRYGHVGAH